MLTYKPTVFWSLLICSVSYGGKITEIAGEPAPAEVNLEWSEFGAVDFMESQRLPETISEGNPVITEEGMGETGFSLCLLTAKLSGGNLQNPEENKYWRSSRNIHQTLLNKSIEQKQPQLTKRYARSFLIHLVGGNSLQHRYTLDPGVMEKIRTLCEMTETEGQPDDGAEAFLRWAEIYQWTSEKKDPEDWNQLDFLKKAESYKGGNIFLDQLYYAVRFRYLYYSHSPEAYKLYESEILPCYRSNGIMFSCYFGFLHPYAEIGRLMSDVESHHQSIAINRISLERLKAEKSRRPEESDSKKE
jgi:hypothetical protein